MKYSVEVDLNGWPKGTPIIWCHQIHAKQSGAVVKIFVSVS